MVPGNRRSDTFAVSRVKSKLPQQGNRAIQVTASGPSHQAETNLNTGGITLLTNNNLKVVLPNGFLKKVQGGPWLEEKIE